MSRAGRRPGDDPEAVAEFAITLLACLRGSICLYQGEELGLEEAEIAFEDLRDPYGIRFWPGFKGRDGCRTPMVWEAPPPNAGFSSGKPWLPVPQATARRRLTCRSGMRLPCCRATARCLPCASDIRHWSRGSIEFLERRRISLPSSGQDTDRKAALRLQFRGRAARMAAAGGRLRTFCRTPALLRTACLCFPDVAPSLPGF